VEFICPHCGARDQKNARRERALYHLRMAFCRTCREEVTQCHACKQYLRWFPLSCCTIRMRLAASKLFFSMNTW